MKKLIKIEYIFILFTCLGCLAGSEESSISRGYVSPEQLLSLTIPSDDLDFNASTLPASVTFSGTCSEEGTNFSLKVNGQRLSEIECLSNSFTTDINSNQFSEGINLVKLEPINGSSVTLQVSVDTVLPTIAFTNINTVNQSNETSYSLEGTCSDNGQTVSGSFDVLPFSTTCTNGTWSSASLNLSFYVDATYTATISTTDNLGNDSGDITSNILKDTVTPLPTLSFVTPLSGFGNTNSTTIRVSGINTGYTVEAFNNAACTNSLQSIVSGGVTADLVFNNAGEGTYKYYFKVTDLVPSTSTCLGPITYVEDQTNPVSPSTYILSSPGDGETSNDSTPQISGTIDASEEGSVVHAYRDAACSDEIGSNSVSSGTFSILGSLAVDGSHNGLNQFYIKVIDRASNTSSCIDTGLSYTLSGGGLASLPKLAMVGNDSPSSLVSLEDGNQITWRKASDPNNPIDLGTINKGDVISIEDPSNAADKVDQGDFIESTGACYVVTQGFGTAPWASDAYAGKKFSTYQYRYGQFSPKVYVAAINQTSFVQILQDTDNDGDLDVVDFQNVPAGTVHEFTVTLTNGRPWQVVGTENINIYYVARSSGAAAYDRDARVLTPAATDIVGFSFYITSLENDTTVNAYQNRNVAVYNGTIDVNQSLTTQRSAKGSIQLYATRVIADKPVSQLQIADGDGANATPHLPVNYLATVYGIPRNADYVGIISLGAATVDVYQPDGTLKHTRTLAQTAGANALAPYAYRYTDGATVPAGTTFECSAPCFMIYDDESAGADRDETLMMGFTP